MFEELQLLVDAATTKSAVKKIKLIFINMNMGASEAAIAAKVRNKFRAKYPDLEIELEQHFYAGKLIQQEIKPHKSQVDVSLLKSYGIKGNTKNKPYKTVAAVSEDVKKAKTNPVKDGVIEIKILMAQTTDCGKYSKASQKIQKDRQGELKKKQTESELSYFADFKMAMTWNPDIVICENVSHIRTASGKEILQKIGNILEGSGLQVVNHEIKHERATGSNRD